MKVLIEALKFELVVYEIFVLICRKLVIEYRKFASVLTFDKTELDILGLLKKLLSIEKRGSCLTLVVGTKPFILSFVAFKILSSFKLSARRLFSVGRAIISTSFLAE